MGNRVYVTGVGVVSPAGRDPGKIADRLLEGHSWPQYEPSSDIRDLGVTSTARVDPKFLDLPYRETRKFDRATIMGMLASQDALAMAGLHGQQSSVRCGVALSGGMLGLTSTQETLDAIARSDSSAITPHTLAKIMPNSLASAVAVSVEARCGTFAPVSACASSSEAIARGFELVKTGRADVAIVGGAESLMDSRSVSTFVSMRAISRSTRSADEISRPFDADRTGFVMSEGAAVLVLESESHADARGATSMGEICGYGITSDGYHLSAPRPDGSEQARAMRIALSDATLLPSDIDVVFAHATSTRIGDQVEAGSLADVFAGHDTPIAAMKGQTGHLLGASGSMAASLALSFLRAGVVPSIHNLVNPDVGYPLMFIRGSALAFGFPNSRRRAIVNAFGFGGQNVSFVLST